MTFRRRLFVATLIVGGGVCCFQPIMRSRMEARLSEIVGGKVEIGSSKISLRDSTIALSDIVIQPFDSEQSSESAKSPNAIRVGQAALKFNWNSVFYRNFKAASFLATDVEWKLAAPKNQSIPIANESGTESFLNQADFVKAQDASVESLIQPIKLRLTEESAIQSRAQQKIAHQLKSISDRLVELMPTEGALNVLRQRYVVDDATKQILEVKQWIAENRTARKEADKAINFFVLSAQKQFVSKVNSVPELDTKLIQQAAIKIATQAIAKEWNQSRPVIQAALSSLTSLQKSTETPFADAENKPAGSNGPNGSNGSNAPNAVILSQLPVGLTHCSSGKISGSVQFPIELRESSDSGFVLQFWNLASRYCLDSTKPTVALKLNRDPKQEESTWLVCIAQQVALPQSDAVQIQFTLEKKNENLGLSSAKIQHANRGWSANLSIPTQCCFDTPALKAIATESKSLNEKACINGKLIGTTPSEGANQDNLLIEIDPNSLIALEKILASWHKADSEMKKVRAGIRGTEQLNNELLVVNSRWKQLGDEHSQSHDSWKSRIAELDDQIRQLGSSFQRTSRVTGVPH